MEKASSEPLLWIFGKLTPGRRRARLPRLSYLPARKNSHRCRTWLLRTGLFADLNTTLYRFEGLDAISSKPSVKSPECLVVGLEQNVLSLTRVETVITTPYPVNLCSVAQFRYDSIKEFLFRKLVLGPRNEEHRPLNPIQMLVPEYPGLTGSVEGIAQEEQPLNIHP